MPKLETVITNPDQLFRADSNETQSLRYISFNARDTEARKDTATNAAAVPDEIPFILKNKHVKKL